MSMTQGSTARSSTPYEPAETQSARKSAVRSTAGHVQAGGTPPPMAQQHAGCPVLPLPHPANFFSAFLMDADTPHPM